MGFEPPFTKLNLQQEEHKSNNKTQRKTAIRRKIQPNREVNQRTANGLGDIIR